VARRPLAGGIIRAPNARGVSAIEGVESDMLNLTNVLRDVALRSCRIWNQQFPAATTFPAPAENAPWSYGGHHATAWCIHFHRYEVVTVSGW
jgi:hypothetical protein